MKEDKPNREDILKGIAFHAEGGKGVGYIDEYKCKTVKFSDILGLINRQKAEIERYEAVNKLLERDNEYLQKALEDRIEDVYADFMKDYKIMRDELNGLYDEYAELIAEREKMQATINGMQEERENMQEVIFALEEEKRQLQVENATLNTKLFDYEKGTKKIVFQPFNGVEVE